MGVVLSSNFDWIGTRSACRPSANASRRAKSRQEVFAQELSPNLAAFGVGKETWEETALRNEERKVIAETILRMEVKKRELMWHLEEIAGNDTHEAYLEREMWDRLAKSRKDQSVAAEEAFTVEETAVALLTLHEAQIKRSNIIAALNRIVPLGSKVLNEDG